MKKADIIILAFSAFIFLIIGIGIYKTLSMPLRQTKDFQSFYIEEGYVFDAEKMIDPPEEFSALLQIDQDMRMKVAEYMKEHNYKLRSGKQRFIRSNPTFKELIENCFWFEPINSHD